jgi:hypothetical protein
MGFGGAAENVREDTLAVRLIAAGPQAVGDLILKLRGSAVADVPGAKSAHEVAAGRARLAENLVSQLAALGFGNEARALVPTKHAAVAAVAVQPGATFLNVGEGV